MRITLSQSNSQKFQFLVTGDEPVAFRLLVRSDALTLSYGRLFEAKGRWPPSGSNEPSLISLIVSRSLLSLSGIL